MANGTSLKVKGTEVTLLRAADSDYISLTDIARYRDPDRTDYLIQNWLRNRNTVELLGLWEQIYNPDFNPIEFDGIKKQAGLNSFILTAKKWIDSTNAVGLISKAGRYGGTYAHKDIAFEFASWISIEFKLYIIKEFQRLKEEEQNQQNLQWNLQRTLAKINYHIQTDAIRDNLLPKELSRKDVERIYANEADLLNMALFGMTAKQWRDSNPGTKDNLREQASLEQLVVLSNLESINAMLIHQGIPHSERLLRLNQMAISQMLSLLRNGVAKQLKG